MGSEALYMTLERFMVSSPHLDYTNYSYHASYMVYGPRYMVNFLLNVIAASHWKAATRLALEACFSVVSLTEEAARCACRSQKVELVGGHLPRDLPSLNKSGAQYTAAQARLRRYRNVF